MCKTFFDNVPSAGASSDIGGEFNTVDCVKGSCLFSTKLYQLLLFKLAPVDGNFA